MSESQVSVSANKHLFHTGANASNVKEKVNAGSDGEKARYS